MALSKPLIANSPTISHQRELDSLAVIQGNSLLAMNYLPLPEKLASEPIKAIKRGYFIGVEEVKELLGENKLISCLIENESNWNINAWNKNDPNGGSKGLLQFQETTFYYYAKQYGFYDFEVYNPEHQIKLAKIMIEAGLGYHWTTFQLCN